MLRSSIILPLATLGLAGGYLSKQRYGNLHIVHWSPCPCPSQANRSRLHSHLQIPRLFLRERLPSGHPCNLLVTTQHIVEEEPTCSERVRDLPCDCYYESRLCLLRRVAPAYLESSRRAACVRQQSAWDTYHLYRLGGARFFLIAIPRYHP